MSFNDHVSTIEHHNGTVPLTDDFELNSTHSRSYIESIQCQLDDHIKDMSAEWKASIPFRCHVIHDNENSLESLQPNHS